MIGDQQGDWASGTSTLLVKGGSRLPYSEKTLRIAFVNLKVAGYPQSFNTVFTGMVALLRPRGASCDDPGNFRSATCTGFPQDSHEISTIVSPVDLRFTSASSFASHTDIP